jgi:hypothetical protein
MSATCTISTKSGPWRDAVALLHRFVVGDALLEGVQHFGALAVERNLHHRAQAVTQNGREAVGVQDRDLALDQPGLPQPLDAPQAGGWGHMHLRGQGEVAEGGVGLQGVQQPKIGFVDVDRFHNRLNYEIKVWILGLTKCYSEIVDKSITFGNSFHVQFRA